MATSVMALLVLLFMVAVCSATSDQDPLLVQTVQGKVKGNVLKTYTGKDILSFRGIKYAEAPSGQNRFKVSLHCFSINLYLAHFSSLCYLFYFNLIFSLISLVTFCI